MFKKKTSTSSAGDPRDTRSLSGSGRSPGVWNGNSLQYSCLGSSVASMGSQRVRYDWAHTHLVISLYNLTFDKYLQQCLKIIHSRLWRAGTSHLWHTTDLTLYNSNQWFPNTKNAGNRRRHAGTPCFLKYRVQGPTPGDKSEMRLETIEWSHTSLGDCDVWPHLRTVFLARVLTVQASSPGSIRSGFAAGVPLTVVSAFALPCSLLMYYVPLESSGGERRKHGGRGEWVLVFRILGLSHFSYHC